MDHPRDLFLMINHFREQMPRPIVGLGHSFGGNIMFVPAPSPGRRINGNPKLIEFHSTNLAYLHPRLLTTVLLIDPVIQLTPPAMGFGTDAPGPINYTLRRSDVWPNREVALRANRALTKDWDPRCIDRMAQYGFRELPTRLYPDVDAIKARFNSTETPVTLTTSKHQDLIGQIRENFGARDPATGRIAIDRATHADMDPLAAFIPMYRPEPRSIFLRLPSLRPSCVWVLGGSTYLKLDEIREGIKACGTGVGGSGGLPEGRVREVTLTGLGHLMPFQEVKKVAEPCVAWLEEEMERFRQAEKQWEERRRGMNHLELNETWYKVLKPIGGGRSGGKDQRKEKL